MLNWLWAKIITLVLWLPVYVEQITWGMSFRWVKEINIFRIVIYQPVTLRTLSSQEASFLDCEVFSCSVSLKCSCIRSLPSANNCFRMPLPFEIAVLNFYQICQITHIEATSNNCSFTLFLELKLSQEFEKCAKSWSQALVQWCVNTTSTICELKMSRLVALTQDYVLNPFIRNLIPKARGTKSTVKQSQVQTLV